jgi:formate-dependent nitrite reductase membrane component NrfD
MLRKHRVGPLAGVGDAAGLGAGILGVPLAGYTAVLLASTAVPVWQGAAGALPPLFVSSAVTSAASALDLCNLNPFERRVVRRFGIAGKAAELFFSTALEREVRTPEVVGAPLHHGASGALWRAAKVLVASSLLLSLLPESPPVRRAAGWLGTFGSIALRFGIVRAGRISARDPHATFAQQRAREPLAAEPPAPERASAERRTAAARPVASSTRVP